MSWRDDIYAAPSVRRDWCVVCGRPATNMHHVIPNDRKHSPALSLCGMGNASGCHGAAHAHRLHFRVVEVKLWSGDTVKRWEYLWTGEPVKEDAAHEIRDGWRCIHEQG